MPVFLQNLLIVILAAYMAWDNGSGGQITAQWPVTIGVMMGLIMGDLHTALLVGGTLQLMSLGVAAIGGSSIPEYGLATIISIYLAVRTGASTGTAIAVGLPVGIFALQLDVIVKIINNFFAHLSQRLLHEKKFKQMQLSFLCSVLVWTLKYVIPVSVVIMFGVPLVKFIINVIPQWVTDGLTIAGGILPVVGISLLMRYMPVMKYLSYLGIGFVLAAYLNVPILGVAIVGAGISYIIFRQNSQRENDRNQMTTNVEGNGDDFDE
ncbi:mannose/fructose/sorbose-specific PTS system IIC component [Ligilactobacillus salitolerans]|uniref:Mannose/fructose/sorbose-specific PTS system IIC component n=1 Tax=Ligilactobacillus salitolerans TaxID=1808352 RepID=A0A401IRC7_9LACO|nr:PTS sugar transporter subunit IIC [Ligilactobacillus salitolerans]GBG94067.1 mannose/fructose/sorbose-specific PTS system IIC component [Ligilactobacillus salitolerans]